MKAGKVRRENKNSPKAKKTGVRSTPVHSQLETTD
jgi:hypothetical protein